MKWQTCLCVLSLLFSGLSITGEEAEVQPASKPSEIPSGKSEGISDFESLVLIDNELGWQIYNLVSDTESNLVFSPYSLVTALQMVYAGAAELTQSQMARVLHFTPPSEAIKSSAAALTEALITTGKRSSDGPLLLINNSLWVQTGHPILPDFEKSIISDYKGVIKGMDFRNKGDQAGVEINNWVKAQTKEKMTDLLGASDISSATRMLLISTFYMNGKWENPFDPRLTRPMPFFPRRSETLTVPMMTLTADLPYVKKRDFSAVELNYAGKAANPKLAMIIILPNETFGLKRVESSLSAQQLRDLLREFKASRVTISLPKFKVTSTLTIQRALGKMGLTEPFSARADFSTIDGTQDLRMSTVLQKAYISIDEKGTEAGLALSVAFDLKAIKGVTPELFVVDHPYMYYVVDKLTGVILLVGRIIQP